VEVFNLAFPENSISLTENKGHLIGAGLLPGAPPHVFYDEAYPTAQSYLVTLRSFVQEEIRHLKEPSGHPLPVILDRMKTAGVWFVLSSWLFGVFVVASDSDIAYEIHDGFAAASDATLDAFGGKSVPPPPPPPPPTPDRVAFSALSDEWTDETLADFRARFPNSGLDASVSRLLAERVAERRARAQTALANDDLRSALSWIAQESSRPEIDSLSVPLFLRLSPARDSSTEQSGTIPTTSAVSTADLELFSTHQMIDPEDFEGFLPEQVFGLRAETFSAWIADLAQRGGFPAAVDWDRRTFVSAALTVEPRPLGERREQLLDEIVAACANEMSDQTDISVDTMRFCAGIAAGQIRRSDFERAGEIITAVEASLAPSRYKGAFAGALATDLADAGFPYSGLALWKQIASEGSQVPDRLVEFASRYPEQSPFTLEVARSVNIATRPLNSQALGLRPDLASEEINRTLAEFQSQGPFSSSDIGAICPFMSAEERATLLTLSTQRLRSLGDDAYSGRSKAIKLEHAAALRCGDSTGPRLREFLRLVEAIADEQQRSGISVAVALSDLASSLAPMLDSAEVGPRLIDRFCTGHEEEEMCRAIMAVNAVSEVEVGDRSSLDQRVSSFMTAYRRIPSSARMTVSEWGVLSDVSLLMARGIERAGYTNRDVLTLIGIWQRNPDRQVAGLSDRPGRSHAAQRWMSDFARVADGTTPILANAVAQRFATDEHVFRQGDYRLLRLAAQYFSAQSSPAAAVLYPCQPQELVVYFEYESERLTSNALAVLELGRTQVECPSPTITIEGHTDTSEEPDMELSQQRANVVAAEFSQLFEAISLTDMKVTALGETQPARPTPDNVREPLNRRVEITLE